MEKSNRNKIEKFGRIDEEEIDIHIFRYTSTEYFKKYYKPNEIDRTIVRIPNTQVAIIYNKIQETESLQNRQENLKKDDYVLKPLAAIPELDLALYHV